MSAERLAFLFVTVGVLWRLWIERSFHKEVTKGPQPLSPDQRYEDERR
jgi:hypothetical protein